MNTVCLVCELLDGDRSLKPTAYCGLCGAHVCHACRGNWLRRSQAALRLHLGAGARDRHVNADALMKEDVHG